MGGGLEFPIVCRADQATTQDRQDFLQGVIDMGSNGIRFSVSDLSPPTGRILPTLHKHRMSLSLYDAQFDPKTGDRIPLPQSVIDSVVGAILRFQLTCSELGVAPDNIRIVATEATRTAINAEEFIGAIEHKTGLRVEMLSKENEGEVGAWGIASGFSDIEGLAIDLGGGSMQISWIVSHGGNIHLSPKGSFSFPYGAAALTRKLADLQKGKKSKEEAKEAVARFRAEIKANILHAYDQLEIPEALVDRAQREGGFDLFLSGGGFRGWGYLLLYLNQTDGSYYPISIINGYTAHREEFARTDAVQKVAKASHKIFRISDRRRDQVPSIAFLVNVLAEAIPHGIKQARFCQGGVREGVLFRDLSPVIRRQDPLEVGTAPYARPSAEAISYLMLAGIPNPSSSAAAAATRLGFPATISVHVIHAFANALYMHAHLSKESSSAAALYSTSTGLLSSIHGISHMDRALLSLILEERYDGELPPRESDFKERLRQLLTPREIWWTRYLGKLGYVLAGLYPTGVIDTAKPRVAVTAHWSSRLGKDRDMEGVELKFSVQKVADDPFMVKETLEEHARGLEKVGKRKRWIGGRDGWGVKVKVHVVEEHLL